LVPDLVPNWYSCEEKEPQKEFDFGFDEGMDWLGGEHDHAHAIGLMLDIGIHTNLYCYLVGLLFN
jgi:hypothetical protein